MAAIVFSLVFILTLVVGFEGKILAFSLAAACYVGWYSLKVPTKKMIEYREKQEELRQKRLDMGVMATCFVYHIEGLPISEKTKCEVLLTPDSLIIEGAGTSFIIAIKQLRALEVKTDTEISVILDSGAKQGIVSRLAFGDTGLVIGSKAKELRTQNYYLIINYTSSAGEIEAIMFDAEAFMKSVLKIEALVGPMIENNQPKIVTL